MMNSLTFIKYPNSITTTALDNLAADLSASATAISYYFFVLGVIAKRHHSLKVRTEAKQYLTQQDIKQDNFEYLNSCIIFLKKELQKTPAYRVLNQVELSERGKSLTDDICIFIELNNTITKACFRFTNDYFITGFDQSFMAA